MGRFFICSEASRCQTPLAQPSMAVRKRAAVPALPTLIAAVSFGMRPPRPVTRTVWAGSSTTTSKPRSFKHCRKCLESSLNRAPFSSVSPLARAASIRARLVMLLEPGASMVSSKGCVGWLKIGCTLYIFMGILLDHFNRIVQNGDDRR